MPVRNELTWSSHKQRWKSCTACDACNRRRNVVLLRGIIPCDMLFIGESPGMSEDNNGQPFIGEAGHFLDSIVARAIGTIEGIDIAFTNVVACIPEKDGKGKLIDPSAESIEACAPRLREIVKLCQPRVIIRVGKLAQEWLPKLISSEAAEKFVDIVHPSAILQAEDSMKPLLVKRTIVALRDVIEELVI